MFSSLLRLSTLVCLVSCSLGVRKMDLVEGKTHSNYESLGKKYMISTQGAATSRAAKYVLDQGGNIYDAAVAASFVISVERPHSTGLGGGGFLLSYSGESKESWAYDFREMAPRKSFQKMFLGRDGKQLKNKSLTGAMAAGVPGLVAGILKVHADYGKLPLKTILKPAIDLAREGFNVYPALSKAMKAKRKTLCKYPESRKIFLKPGCIPFDAGELLIQKDLANTIELIVKHGEKGFYSGRVAHGLIKTQRKYRGVMRKSDLKNYIVKKRKPVVGTFKGHKIVSMPSPSSGGTHIIQILNMLESDDLKSLGAQNPKTIHLVTSAMQRAFADRAKYMGDADFQNVPVKKLISKSYAKKLRASFGDKATPSDKIIRVNDKIFKESDDTTHFTIMDSKGNIVSSTQTINGWFGSSLVAGGTGVLFNNEMDDFASHIGGVNLFGAIGGKNNLVEPRKRPLSSMSPTIVFNDKEEPILALGTPSGTRILTCVMQTILNYVEFKMPLWSAVAATRYHHQWKPDQIRIGKPYFTKSTEEELVRMGYNIKHKDLGCKIQAIAREGEMLHGVSDPREEGMSIGL